mmetsp:Transcript_14933/g.36079  ORF Transcript_14933/g.36079 Transcript_14933/m.36079 type:complete len:387 (-) Transcript_14933:204-1364(-)
MRLLQALLPRPLRLHARPFWQPGRIGPPASTRTVRSVDPAADAVSPIERSCGGCLAPRHLHPLPAAAPNIAGEPDTGRSRLPRRARRGPAVRKHGGPAVLHAAYFPRPHRAGPTRGEGDADGWACGATARDAVGGEDAIRTGGDLQRVMPGGLLFVVPFALRAAARDRRGFVHMSPVGHQEADRHRSHRARAAQGRRTHPQRGGDARRDRAARAPDLLQAQRVVGGQNSVGVLLASLERRPRRNHRNPRAHPRATHRRPYPQHGARRVPPALPGPPAALARDVAPHVGHAPPLDPPPAPPRVSDAALCAPEAHNLQPTPAPNGREPRRAGAPHLPPPPPRPLLPLGSNRLWTRYRLWVSITWACASHPVGSLGPTGVSPPRTAVGP